MGRWIGLDYGLRRIGVATADYRGVLAFPTTALAAAGRAAEDAAAVLRWAADQDAGGFVVGLPLNMDGSESQQTALTRAFAAELARQLQAAAPRPPGGDPGPGSVSVELWDERLSSFQADEYLEAAGIRSTPREGPAQRRRRKERRDALAALVILQSFLDARRTNEPSHEPP